RSVRLRARHLRGCRLLPPRRRGGVRAPVGPGGRDVGGPPAALAAPTAMSLWKERFGVAPADQVVAFTESLSFDVRLAGDDVTGSRAHVRGLERAGILSPDERDALLVALDRVGEELEGGRFA